MHARKKTTVAALLLALSAYAGNTQAVDLSPAWYIGAGIGASKIGPETAGSGLFVQDDSDFAWQIMGGYRFNKSISLELAYTDLGDARLAVAGTGAYAGDVSHKQTTLGMVWSPVMQGQPDWRPFLKGGLNYSDHEWTGGALVKDEVRGFFGVGVEKFFGNGDYSVRADLTTYGEDAHSIQVNFVKYFLD